MMMRETTLMRALDYLTEACWLLALIAIPIYFDILTVRIFEPDKIVLFRNIVLVMVLAALLRLLLGAPSLLASAKSASALSGENAGGTAVPPMHKTPLWRRAQISRPMLLPVGIFVFIYALATVHSVLPGISFWGSYDRMEGFYTWLNYIAFFLVLSYRLRIWIQIERIVNALIFTSVPIAFYGIMQHLQWDPLPWGADTTVRVASTLGNSIFLGAYLLMCMPFAAYRIWRAAELLKPAPMVVAPAAPPVRSNRARQTAAQIRQADGPTPLSIWSTIAFYGLILLIDFLAMFFSGSKGPYYGLCAAIAVMGVPLTLKFAKPLPFIGAIVLAVAIFAIPLGLNFISSTSTAAAAGSSGASIAADAQHLTDVGGPTSQTREFIWQGSVPLILHNPILGYGPETMIYVYAPYYPPGLGHLEHSNAAPDRNHDLWLDFLVFSGILGLLAWLGVLGGFGLVIWRIFKRTGSSRVTLLTATILAVVIGDLVEGSVGIPIVSTLMVQWTMFGLATAVLARPELLTQSVAVLETAATTVAEPARGRKAGAPPRRGPRPVVVPTSPWERLTGRQRGGVIGGVLALVVAALVAIGLFANNIQVVRADAAYKNGQAYDNAASACIAQLQSQQTSGSCPYSATPGGTTTSSTILQQISNDTGQFLLPQALASFGEAAADQPSQDMYDLWMGKTYLDKATYDLITNNRSDAVTQFDNAEQTLMTAHALNPQNADHPMNLARMYSLWAQSIDPSKWLDADKYFAIATDLARHNGRWFDEWGRADMVQAQQTSITGTVKTGILHKALAAFTQAANVDDQLGDARAYRGDAQLQLKMYAAAAASYREALRVGGFEIAQYQPQNGAGVSSSIAANLFTALAQAHDYKGMTTADAYAPSPGVGQAAVTLAYSPTIALLSAGSPYSPTVNSGIVALAAHGYLPAAVAALTSPTQGSLLLQPQSPVLQAVIGALYVAKDYKNLVAPVYNKQSLMTLASTPAIGLNATTSPFFAALTTIQTTLRQKGYLK